MRAGFLFLSLPFEQNRLFKFTKGCGQEKALSGQKVAT